MLRAEKKNLKVEYETVELYPVPIEIIKQLNYPQQLNFAYCYGPYHTMHLVRWDEWHELTPYFHFRKINTSLLEVTLTSGTIDLIYFDAFAPEHQPEMWSVEVFRKLYEALAPGGILMTYCSKGTVQRAMKEVGFSLEKLPGPPGKREMLRARKN